MWEGTETIDVAAPPEAVWAVVADLSRHPALAGSGEVLSVRASGPLAVGTTWESDERVSGRSFVARSECVEFDAPRTLAWKSWPPPLVKGNPDSVLEATWWFRLSPGGAGTRVEHSFRVVEPKVGAGRLKLFYLLTRRPAKIHAGMRRTLANLKRLAE